MGPAGPTAPSGPAMPCGPSGPWGPLAPCGPCSPSGPCIPAAPWGPGGPAGPVGPWGPGGPCSTGPVSEGALSQAAAESARSAAQKGATNRREERARVSSTRASGDGTPRDYVRMGRLSLWSWSRRSPLFRRRGRDAREVQAARVLIARVRAITHHLNAHGLGGREHVGALVTGPSMNRVRPNPELSPTGAAPVGAPSTRTCAESGCTISTKLTS